MNLRFLLVVLLLLAIAILVIEGKKGGNGKGNLKSKGKGNLKSKGKKDKIKGLLNKKGPKGSKGRKVKVKLEKTRTGDSLNVQVEEGGPLLSFKQNHKKPRGSKKCVFSGVDPEDPDNTIVVSQCKHFKAGAVEIDGEEFNVNTDSGELDDNVTEVDFTGINDAVYAQPEEDYEKKWDAKLGDWVVEKVNKTIKKEKHKQPMNGKEKSNQKEKSRKRRQTTELYLQLGVYIDEALWKQFLKKYGDENSEQAVREFAEYITQFIEIKYSKGLTYPVRFTLSKLEIWKTQPTSITNTAGDVMTKFLSQCKEYINPFDLGLDDVIVFSGLELSGAAGYAYLSAACSNIAVGVANQGVDGRGVGVVSHELGHTLGMSHGGLYGGCEQPGLGPPFTACSRTQFDTYLAKLDKEERNCLRDPFISEPIGLEKYPGQVFPPMHQCQTKGRCYVHSEQEQLKLTDPCSWSRCNSYGDISWWHNSGEELLDGAYCGAGKICMLSECVALDSGLGALVAVHGGWSPTWAMDVENCGGKCSDECKMAGQLNLETEYRPCNNPHPKNGGKYCAGSNYRSKVCGTCATGASTKEEYIKNKCNARAIAIYCIWMENKEDSCTWVCWPDGGQGFYIKLDNGIECEDGGRCVNSQCLKPCVGSPDYYTLLPNECPPVDDTMQWQLQTKTGEGYYDNTDGDVYIVINGSLGSSEPIIPDTPHDDYQVGAIDTFDLETKNIGQLTSIVVGMETSTDGWLMEWCTLTLKNTGKVYKFTLNKTIDNDEPDEKNQYTLTPTTT